MGSGAALALGQEVDPERRIRLQWAESLADHLRTQQISRKELRRRLAGLGVEVTEQGIGAWLRGETAPRPHHQAALGTVLNVPARRLFPLENLPAVDG